MHAAEALAGALLEDAMTQTSDGERAQAKTLSRLALDPAGQSFTTQLTDRAYRTPQASRTAAQLRDLVQRFGVPSYLPAWQRMQLWAAARAARLLPGNVASGVRRRLRMETRHVLLSSDEAAVDRLLSQRHSEQTQVNLNKLGESLLGETDAEARVQQYEKLAGRRGVDAVSVKVSSIGSQLHALAFEETVALLSKRLARIYESSLSQPEGLRPLVMLDMEAYRHIELTLAVMQAALSSSARDPVRAGVVIQAYLPDALGLFQNLSHWARVRTSRGGQPIHVRLVKGANLAAETQESARLGIPTPTFGSKVEVDANYKRLLEHAIDAESLGRITLGVASHNVFDIAYALVLAHERGVPSEIGIEVLEGMADPLRRALVQLGVKVLVYAPICGEHEFHTGIAYLMRRLEENTSKDNFLSASFGMRKGDASFERERLRFRSSVARIDSLELRPRRSESVAFDRTLGSLQPALGEFRNEPDTDFSRTANRSWLGTAFDRLHTSAPPLTSMASPEAIERVLRCAAADPAGFAQREPRERAQMLRKAAQALRAARSELIALMVTEGAKRAPEADTEISEAIDFAEYYQSSFLSLLGEIPAHFSPRGVVLVTPPWNFPLAIPAGGVLAALMAGNRVILKPALETPRIASRMVELFHAAGVPPEALQLVVCEDEVASALVRDPRVDSIILTGATETARLFQRLRPGLHLLAETGGKNAFIVSAMSDRDQAIADVVASAFGHSGQKCSAASLLILEAELYDDPRFMETLRDAVESLPVGPTDQPQSFVTPLIAPPRGALAHALAHLEPGESWLVMPRIDAACPRLVSPGVKLGITPQSHLYNHELFGPVLGVMRADNFEHAIELANNTGYGLTAGLASLDEHEQARFVRKISAGNLYINRTTTGAVVERQPFGGFGKSGFGPGAKAGGPNYVAQLCRVEPVAPSRVAAHAKLTPVGQKLVLRAAGYLAPHAMLQLEHIAADYEEALNQYFLCIHDPQQIPGQLNAFRYLPEPDLVLRIEHDAQPLSVAASVFALNLLEVPACVSIAPGFVGPTDTSYFGMKVRVESLESLAQHLAEGARVRLLGARTDGHRELAAARGAYLADAPLLPYGRLELLHYLREQSVCFDYHRYGQVPRTRPQVVQPWK